MQEDAPIGPAPAFNAPAENSAITWFQVLDALPLAFFLLDADHTILRVNKQAANLWDLGPAQWAGMPLQQFFTRAGNPDMYEATLALFRKKTPAKATFFARVQQKWIEVTAGHTAVGRQLCFADITDLVRSQEEARELAKQNARLQQQIEQAGRMEAESRAARRRLEEAQQIGHIGSFEWSRDFDEGHWSDELYRIYGLAPQQTPMTLNQMLNYTHPEDRERLEQEIFKVRQQACATRCSHRIVRADGEVRYLIRQFESMADAWGQVTMVRGTVQDVTDQKRQEEAITKHLSILQQSEELARMGSWEYDVGTGAFLWSEGMYRLFGLAPGTPVQPEIYRQYVQAEDRDLAEAFIHRLRQAPQPFEETLRVKVGNRRKIFRIKALVIADPQGRPAKVLGVDLDITEVQKLEQENLAMKLRQQKKLILAILEAQEAERKRIAEGLHNGVAQLLYAVRLNLDLLTPAQNAYQQQAGHLLDEAIDETRRISHELMPPILEDRGLAAAITDIGRKYSGKNLELSCQVSSLKHPLPKHLQLAIYRIAQELANNIVKHAGATRASIQIRQQDRYIALLAEDNGTGFIPAPKLADGIGLKTIRDRVNLLNGTMSIDSQPNKGTLISIYLPTPPVPRSARRRH